MNNLPTVVFPKGRLYNRLYNIFAHKGIILPNVNTRQYWFPEYFPDCNLFIAKPKAIPNLIYSKIAEYGFCGKDIMENNDYDGFSELFDTGLNKIKMVIASKNKDLDLTKIDRPVIIATEFDKFAGNLFAMRGIPHYILNSYGSTEGYIDIGADIIIDIIETGETLKANNLFVNEVLFESSTRLYQHDVMCDNKLPKMLEELIIV